VLGLRFEVDGEPLPEAMTLMQVEKRVKVLEKTMRHVLGSKSLVNRRWYRTQAGRFAHDPVFDKIVKLGRAYRKSLKPAAHSNRG
jgi:hypothetical protein